MDGPDSRPTLPACLNGHKGHPHKLRTKLHKIAGITSKNRRDDAKCLNINVVTVTNDAKAEKRKTQRKAE